MGAGLSDSELRVMSAIWRAGGQAPAKAVIDALACEDGLSSSAAYTLIYRCIKKGAVERIDPGFICRATISQQQMQDEQTSELAERLFDGSIDKLFAALVDRKRVSADEIERLRTTIDSYGKHFE